MDPAQLREKKLAELTQTNKQTNKKQTKQNKIHLTEDRVKEAIRDGSLLG